MKKIFTLLLFLICFESYSQSILQTRINPSNPDDTNAITFFADLAFPSGGCNLEHQSVNMNGSNISVMLFHCTGALTVICYITDSIPLGILPAGIYNLSTSLFYGAQDSFGNCTSYVQSDQTNFQFSVLLSTGTNELYDLAPIVISKNKKLVFTNLKTNYDLLVYDALGKEVCSKNISPSDNEIVLNLTTGFYFYSLSKNGAQKFSGKKILVN